MPWPSSSPPIAGPRFQADAAVIGAGPSGARTARDLAREGVKVLLIEEHRQVGIPSHCSGLISPRTWEMGEIGDEALVCNRLRGAFLHVADDTYLPLGGDKVQAVAIDRVMWDRALAQQAWEAGAEPVHARFVGAERVTGGVQLYLQRGDKTFSAYVRLLIGADGAHSRVAYSMGLPRPEERVLALGVEAHLDLPREDYVHIFVGEDVAPGWFGWAIPAGPGLARLGIGCVLGKGIPMELYRAFKERFLRPFGPVRELRFYGGVIPLSPAKKTYGPHVLLVGDAAGQAKPLSGGGLYMGLLAASVCAQAALRALARDDLSPSGLAWYEKEWRRRLGRELARARHLRRAGLGLSSRELVSIVRALERPRVQEVAVRYADIDYPSRSLLRAAAAGFPLLAWACLRHPSLAWHLVRALLAWG